MISSGEIEETTRYREIRKIDSRSLATIGVLSNPDQKNIKIGKAGRSRWLGRKPHTRGVVKNPVDHPHGGGEGKTSGGRTSVTPWGKPTLGAKTRKRKKITCKIHANSYYMSKKIFHVSVKCREKFSMTTV